MIRRKGELGTPGGVPHTGAAPAELARALAGDPALCTEMADFKFILTAAAREVLLFLA